MCMQLSRKQKCLKPAWTARNIFSLPVWFIFFSPSSHLIPNAALRVTTVLHCAWQVQGSNVFFSDVTIRGYVVFLSFQTFRSLKLDQERFSSTFLTILLIDGRWVAESDVKYSLIFRGFYGDGRLWPSVVLLHRIGSGTSHVTSAVMKEAVYICETSVSVWKVARCHSPVG